MGLEEKDIMRFGKDAQRQILSQLTSRKEEPMKIEKTSKFLFCGIEFDSKGELEYYATEIRPRLQAEEYISCETHRKFILIERADKFDRIARNEIAFTPDFIVTDRAGKVTVIEVKGTQIRKWQRDYPIRRRMFIDLYCVPAGWEYREIIIKEK